MNRRHSSVGPGAVAASPLRRSPSPPQQQQQQQQKGERRSPSPPSGAAGKSALKQGGRGGGGGKGKTVRPALSSLAQEVLSQGVYHERTIWSARFKAWSRFNVRKPRLPVDGDKARWVDQPRYKPSSLKGVVGAHNVTTIRTLENFVQNFESLKSLQDLTIIHGPSGSGKSMLAYLYVTELAETMDLGPSSFAKWALVVDGAAYDDVHGHELISKIQKFIEPKLENSVTVAFRVVVVDNADQISHSNQTSLKKVMDTNLMKLKWILTCGSVKNLIGTMQTRGVLLTTKLASEKDSLLILLFILQRNRVGFEREALERLFDLHRPGLSLSAMLDVLQQTFLRFHFVSAENVTRAFGAKPQKLAVSPLAPLGETLARCRVCTLVPPCSHQPLDVLLAKAAAITAKLPPRGTGAGAGAGPVCIVCPSFARAGVCDVFLRHGRCSLAHPPNLHTIKQARRVCPQCTVAWPCNHCSYSSERKRLIKTLELIRRRLQLLTEINVPDPPAYLIRKIVDQTDDWQAIIQGLASFYLTKDREAVLAETEAWIENGYSADVKAYVGKIAALVRAFGEIIKSPLLVEPTFSRANSRGAKAGTDDDNSSVLSSLGSIGSLSLQGGDGVNSRSPSPTSPSPPRGGT